MSEQFMNWLAGGGALGNLQRQKKIDEEAELARLFKEQQMKTAKIQQQAAELQLKQAQQPDDKIIQSPDGRIFVVSKDPNTGQYGQPRPIDQPRQGATAPATVGAGGGIPGIPLPGMSPSPVQTMPDTGMGGATEKMPWRAPMKPPVQPPMATPGFNPNGRGFNALPEPKRSATYLKVVDEGLTPGTPEFVKRVQELNSRSGQTINVGKDKPGYGEQMDSALLETFMEGLPSARQTMMDAEVGLNILQRRIQTGNETGKWAPMQAEVAAWLGVEPEKVADAQLFDTKMGDWVMGRIQETKGAVSEKEMAYFNKISPGSDKDPFTNYALLEIARRQAFRKQDMAKRMYEFEKTGKRLAEFEDWYMENHDPFGDFDIGALRNDYKKWAANGIPAEDYESIYEKADAIVGGMGVR